jgi:hypothetical protein
MEFLKNMDHTAFEGRNEVNILDVKVHTQFDKQGDAITGTDTLVLLEETNGLYFFNQTGDEYNFQFQINFPRAKAFSHYHDTFMIIAETVNKIEYVAEIFVDVNTQMYYFNRVYIEDTAFIHIEMTH